MFSIAFALLETSNHLVHSKHCGIIPYCTRLWSMLSNIFKMSLDLVSLKNDDKPPTVKGSQFL